MRRPCSTSAKKLAPSSPTGHEVPEVDIAVDPLEGTNLCATGAPGAITVLAASESGGLLNAPDCYMEKIVVGPSCKGAVNIDAPVIDNLKNILGASRATPTTMPSRRSGVWMVVKGHAADESVGSARG